MIIAYYIQCRRPYKAKCLSKGTMCQTRRLKFCLISDVAKLHKLGNCFVGFVLVSKPFMCGSAASRQPGLITVAIKTIKNVSPLLAGSSCHRTSGATAFLATFHLFVTHKVLSSPPLLHTLCLPLHYSRRSARNSRNTLPILHASRSCGTGMCSASRRSEGRNSIIFLNEKLERREGDLKKGFVQAPPPSGGVRGSNLVV